jgi:hypothetical protein
MSNVQVILSRAHKLGLRLDVEGDRIAISPAHQCPPDLLKDFREHKIAVMAILAEGQAAGLTSDCVPWLHVARQVLDGEFDGADRSTRESLAIGLRSIRHPQCGRALTRLNPPTSGDGRKV